MLNIEDQLNPNRWSLYKKNYSFGSKKIYIANQFQNLPTNDFFPQRFIPPTGIRSNLINKIRITNSLVEADYVLVPHDWGIIYKNKTYTKYLDDLSKISPLLILNTGDLSPKVPIINKIEIRTFLHPWEKNIGKIIIPYPSKSKQFKIRKWSSFPTIAFMGYVPKFSLGTFTGRHLKSIFYPIKSSVYVNRKFGTYRLKRLSEDFNSKFIKRDTFTAYHKNPNLNVTMLEYEESLIDSDYILCPRGFGNTSIRFYECLSAGRTPIVIESNGGLPVINKEFDWAKHIIRLGLFSDWESIIKNDWEFLGKSNEYEKRQVQNNKLFTSNLEFNSYTSMLFKHFLK